VKSLLANSTIEEIGMASSKLLHSINLISNVMNSTAVFGGLHVVIALGDPH
jgi:hypothetical protein